MKITLFLQIYLTTIIYYLLFCHLLGTKSGESFQQKEFCKQIEFVLITAWWHPVCQSGEGASSIWAFKQTMTFSTASHRVWLSSKKYITTAMSSSQLGGTLFVRWGWGVSGVWAFKGTSTLDCENHLFLKYELEKRLRSVYRVFQNNCQK